MSETGLLESMKSIGVPIAMVFGIAVSWGTTQSEIGQLRNDVSDLNTEQADIVRRRDAWESRVLPLDATQDSKIEQLEAALRRLQSDVQDIERELATLRRSSAH